MAQTTCDPGNSWIFWNAQHQCRQRLYPISGTFREFGWSNKPDPLDNASFSGLITLASLPTAGNTPIITLAADLNFFDASSNLVFNVGGNGGNSYTVMSVNGSGSSSITVSGLSTNRGGWNVAPLGMEFSNWLFGSLGGTALSYQAPTLSFVALVHQYRQWNHVRQSGSHRPGHNCSRAIVRGALCD